MLDTQEALEEDESTVNYQIYQFYPETGAQLNDPGYITITVNNSNNFYHPAHLWLEFEGQLLKRTDGVYADTDVIAFVKYGILYLSDLINTCSIMFRLKLYLIPGLWPTFLVY